MSVQPVVRVRVMVMVVVQVAVVVLIVVLLVLLVLLVLVRVLLVLVPRLSPSVTRKTRSRARWRTTIWVRIVRSTRPLSDESMIETVGGRVLAGGVTELRPPSCEG